ncbi:hypothetical protein [Nonomuraea dietziae]|uniref:hypothetical protein n=1 Tax=Nonomuraea dietziae TaxID=65515 RepID=UPI003420FC32
MAELEQAAWPDLYAGGSVESLVAELDWIITDAIDNAPRSLQTRIGPSEIGIPCDRRIGYKLAGIAPVNERGIAWKPFIGTAVHEQLGAIIDSFNARVPGFNEVGPRFLIEWRVPVGSINGTDIDGSCDLYDRVTGTVLDWKCVGGEQLLKYKANGPGEQYRIQAHAYGRGWQRRGFKVSNVAVYFLPRDREFDRRHVWSEPYDEQVAVKALERVDGIAKLATLGPGAMSMLRTADAWCRFCPNFKPGSTDLTASCPGDAAATAPSNTLSSLIA